MPDTKIIEENLLNLCKALGEMNENPLQDFPGYYVMPKQPNFCKEGVLFPEFEPEEYQWEHIMMGVMFEEIPPYLLQSPEKTPENLLQFLSEQFPSSSWPVMGRKVEETFEMPEEIEPILIDDVPEWLELLNHSNAVGQSLTEDLVEKMLLDDRFVLMAAKDNGRPVATGILFLYKQSVGIYQVNISKSHHTQQMEQDLIKAFMFESFVRKAENMLVHATRATTALYQSNGFNEIARMQLFNLESILSGNN